MSNLEFEKVTNQVKEKLELEPLSLSDLVSSVKNSTEDKTIKVIQWLIDNDKLVYNKDNKLGWHK